MLLVIGSWCLCGIILGFVVSRLVNLHGDDPKLGIAVAAIGGILGGFAYKFFSGLIISGLNVSGLIWAGSAAAAALVVWHIIRAFSPHEEQSVRRSY